MLLAGLALLLLVAVVGYLWWSSSTDEPSTSAGPSPSETPKPSRSPSASSTPSKSPTTSPPSQTPTGTGQASGSAKQFVTGYYSLLPDDTKSAWSMLTSGFQDEIGSYGKYQGFWKSIDSVRVTGTSSAGPNAVDTFLKYTRKDGSPASEVRRIFFKRSGDGYLITGDEMVR